jgi:hypothetical protein
MGSLTRDSLSCCGDLVIDTSLLFFELAKLLAIATVSPSEESP